MIQRIQSLYLAGVLLCSLLLFFTAIASVEAPLHIYNFSIYGLFDVTRGVNQKLASTLPLLVLNGIVTLLTVVIIFQFKKRALQIKLARLNILLLVVFVVGTFFYFENASEQIFEIEKLNTEKGLKANYLLGAILPLIAIILNMLAARAIKKDDVLVRSADRIR